MSQRTSNTKIIKAFTKPTKNLCGLYARFVFFVVQVPATSPDSSPLDE